MAEMSEADIALKLVEHFEGFDVYKEVHSPGGGICDIVVKIGHLIICIEVKKTFNVEVIYQAYRHRPHCHLTYVAIPVLKHKRNWQAEELCKVLGIGVFYFNPERAVYSTSHRLKRYLTFSNYVHVNEQITPVYNRPGKAAFRLKEWMKRSVAGSQSERLTDFKVTVEEVTSLLHNKGGIVPCSQFFETAKYHYSSTKGAKLGLQRMCNAGVIKEFRFHKGYITTIFDDDEFQKQLIILKYA